MPGFIISGGEGVDANSPSMVEVARSHRWEITIPDAPRDASDELRFFALSVTRPSFEADKVTMHHRQNELYMPGKTRSGTCSVVLYERILNNVDGSASVMRKWWSQWMMNAKRYSLNMASWKKTLHVSMTDGCGSQTWAYMLNGVWPLKVEGSGLDYASTDLATVAVTLSVDAFEEGFDI